MIDLILDAIDWLVHAVCFVVVGAGMLIGLWGLIASSVDDR